MALSITEKALLQKFHSLHAVAPNDVVKLYNKLDVSAGHLENRPAKQLRDVSDLNPVITRIDKQVAPLLFHPLPHPHLVHIRTRVS